MGKQGRKRQHARSEPQSLAKVPTGIAGLDDTLEGGFPAGQTTIPSGVRLSELQGQPLTGGFPATAEARNGGE